MLGECDLSVSVLRRGEHTFGPLAAEMEGHRQVDEPAALLARGEPFAGDRLEIADLRTAEVFEHPFGLAQHDLDQLRGDLPRIDGLKFPFEWYGRDARKAGIDAQEHLHQIVELSRAKNGPWDLALLDDRFRLELGAVVGIGDAVDADDRDVDDVLDAGLRRGAEQPLRAYQVASTAQRLARPG